MKRSKCLILFLCIGLVLVALYGVFNILIDPFGVFGDVLFDYYEYNITESPGVAKLAYLEENHDDYDSYIIGCSKALAFPTEKLNEYTGASFYNLSLLDGDMADIERLAAYVIENYDPKNIVIEVCPESALKYDSEESSHKYDLHYKASGENPIAFYVKYAFLHPSYSLSKINSYKDRSFFKSELEAFVPETGEFDNTARDSIGIGSVEAYLASAGASFEITHSNQMKHIDECTASIKDIKALCDERGISFKLIASPLYRAEQDCYSLEDMATLWSSLAEVTDFYDFWGYSSISSDERFFYDPYHFRSCVGELALSYIYDPDDRCIPAGFGHYTTAENVNDRIKSAYSAETETYSERVPIIMYHNITDSAVEGATVSVGVFEEQIKALYDSGYTSILYEDLIAYVEKGEPLPELPVIITFDDGYESNISLGAPILEKYGMCAEISVVGVTEGASEYKDTGKKITPHFSLDDSRLKEYISRGILSIQTHTYDLHNVESLDGEGCRTGALQLEGESEKDYLEILKKDFEKASSRIKAALGKSCEVYTYPYGVYSDLSEAYLQSLGIKASVTTEHGVNEIIKYHPQSLFRLKRVTVHEALTGDALLDSIA